MDAQKKSWRYSQRCAEERQSFLTQLAQVKAADRVYMDEAGVDDTLNYAYGWSRKGERCAGEPGTPWVGASHAARFNGSSLVLWQVAKCWRL